MTSQTMAADVLDALLSTWQADATLTGYGDRLRIFDGEPITDRAAEIELWVGSTGDQSAEETVITGTQQWATLADVNDRDESLDVTSCVWVANGSHDIKTARRLAITVFSAAVSAIRGGSLGVTGAFNATGITDWQLTQGQYTSGVGAKLVFTVHVEGYL